VRQGRALTCFYWAVRQRPTRRPTTHNPSDPRQTLIFFPLTQKSATESTTQFSVGNHTVPLTNGEPSILCQGGNQAPVTHGRFRHLDGGQQTRSASAHSGLHMEGFWKLQSPAPPEHESGDIHLWQQVTNMPRTRQTSGMRFWAVILVLKQRALDRWVITGLLGPAGML
jgi:hypothetical protein